MVTMVETIMMEIKMEVAMEVTTKAVVMVMPMVPIIQVTEMVQIMATSKLRLSQGYSQLCRGGGVLTTISGRYFLRLYVIAYIYT